MKKILVVDDNLVELTGLCKMLERSGFSVQGATNGLEALEELKRNSFDLLVTDLWMPRMTGLELLRQLPSAHRPKVILMTGDENIEPLLERLDFEYIIKPFDAHRLIEMITRTLPQEPMRGAAD